MVRIRSNHVRDKSGRAVSYWVRVFLLLLVLFLFIALIRGLFQFNEVSLDSGTSDPQVIPVGASDIRDNYDLEIIYHDNYNVAYSEEHEQAVWVSYQLTRENLALPNVPRTNWFEVDTMVSSGSAVYKDYSGSGYTRGHLAPAGDLAHSEESMKESFLMSNISPQIRGFNGGIWRELEECVRDWAYKYHNLYVVTGPIFKEDYDYIGRANQVAVPSYFYKVVYYLGAKENEGVGFIIPHETSDLPLATFARSIDEVETLTGLDFFVDDMKDGVEEESEGKYDMDNWPIDQERYIERIQDWNYNE